MLSYCGLSATFAANYKISVALNEVIYLLNVIKIVLSLFPGFNTPIIDYLMIYFLKINFSALLLKLPAFSASFRRSELPFFIECFFLRCKKRLSTFLTC